MKPQCMKQRYVSIAVLSLITACLAPDDAQAGCRFPAFDYFPEKNDAVVVQFVVEADTSCIHHFGEGPGYRFTGITVSKKPEKGTLKQTDPTSYVYVPKVGFTGKDAFIFKVCAEKTDGLKGCSTVAYVATVK